MATNVGWADEGSPTRLHLITAWFNCRGLLGFLRQPNLHLYVSILKFFVSPLYNICAEPVKTTPFSNEVVLTTPENNEC